MQSRVHHNKVLKEKIVTNLTQRRRKNVWIFVSNTSKIGMKWNSRRPLFKTLRKHLSGDVLKTSLRRLKTSPRLLLVTTKDNLGCLST